MINEAISLGILLGFYFLAKYIRQLLSRINDSETVVLIGATCGFVTIISIVNSFVDLQVGSFGPMNVFVIGLTGLVWHQSEKLLQERAKGGKNA
jgi:hypothetical protein